MRFFSGFIIVFFTLIWSVYHYFIKKDLDKHKEELYVYMFVSVVWLALYALVFYK